MKPQGKPLVEVLSDPPARVLTAGEWADAIIRSWPDSQPGALLELVESLFNHHYGRWTNGRKYIRIATGGWGDNEALISALQAHPTFWARFWVMSKRGGCHYFERP